MNPKAMNILILILTILAIFLCVFLLHIPIVTIAAWLAAIYFLFQEVNSIK